MIENQAKVIKEVIEAFAKSEWRIAAPFSVRSIGSRTWVVTSLKTSDAAIVKLFAGGDSAFSRETKCLTEMKSHARSFSIPKVLMLGKSAEHSAPYIIMEKLHGICLSELVNARAVTLKNAAHGIAKTLSKFHEIDVSLFESVGFQSSTLVHTADRNYELSQRFGTCDVQYLSRSLRLWMDANRERLEYGQVFCHGDLHFNNILVLGLSNNSRCEVLDEKLVGVIDFESSRIAPREYDLAKSIVTCGITDETLIEEFLDKYEGCWNLDLLRKLMLFCAIDGWLYSKIAGGRDACLWTARVKHVLNYADGFNE